MGFISAIASLIGCSQATPSSANVPLISNDTEHNRYFAEGADLIQPYLKLQDASGRSANSREARHQVERGIALLNAVVVYNPTNWSAFWLMGKAYQTLNDHQKAYNSFGKSYAIQKENPDVAREYMFECLELGKTDEAVPVAEHALNLKPTDAGLHANLALAYILAGRIADARSAIDKSLQIDPSDKISLVLSRRIQQIADGKRSPPRNIRELEQTNP
jgi:tetratricopeptide (TPR) repeat protein